jgi:hypothetical protein
VLWWRRGFALGDPDGFRLDGLDDELAVANDDEPGSSLGGHAAGPDGRAPEGVEDTASRVFR